MYKGTFHLLCGYIKITNNKVLNKHRNGLVSSYKVNIMK